MNRRTFISMTLGGTALTLLPRIAHGKQPRLLGGHDAFNAELIATFPKVLAAVLASDAAGQSPGDGRIGPLQWAKEGLQIMQDDGLITRVALKPDNDQYDIHEIMVPLAWTPADEQQPQRHKLIFTMLVNLIYSHDDLLLRVMQEASEAREFVVDTQHCRVLDRTYAEKAGGFYYTYLRTTWGIRL